MTTNPPPIETSTLPDGAILVEVAGFRGIVSSHHLVPSKAQQLLKAYEASQRLRPGGASPTTPD